MALCQFRTALEQDDQTSEHGLVLVHVTLDDTTDDVTERFHGDVVDSFWISTSVFQRRNSQLHTHAGRDTFQRGPDHGGGTHGALTRINDRLQRAHKGIHVVSQSRQVFVIL
ncbi:hypothetical protein D3C71_1727250 [compost metagenome]